MTEHAPIESGAIPSRYHAGVCLALVTAIAAIYFPVGGFEFHEFDDRGYILDNPDIQQGLTWTSFKAVFSNTYVASWHPLAMVSHTLNVSLFGLNPGPHHLVSVAFHMLNALLLYVFCWRLTGRFAESALIALLWAVHPQHVEPVAWISSRKDVLSTAFMLLALIAYLRYARRPSVPGYIAIALLLTLGLLSKPMLVTLPCVFLLLDFWPLGRMANRPSITRCVVEKLPLFGLCAAFVGVTQWVTQGGGAVVGTDVITLTARVSNSFIAYAHYVGKTIWPSDLSLFYPHSHPGASTTEIAVAIVVIAALSAAAVLQWRRRPFLFTGWFWFVGMLVPVIGLIQFGWHGMADRYTYAPHIGLFIALVWLAAEFVARTGVNRATAGLLACGLIAGYGVASARYVHVFRDDITLFRHIRATVPPHPIVQVNYGIALMRRGHYKEAEHVFREAIGVEPKVNNVYSNIGLCEASRGRYAVARETLLEGKRYMPDDPLADKNLAYVERLIAEAEADVERLTNILRATPGDHDALAELGDLYVSLDRFDEAVRVFTILANVYLDDPWPPRRLGDVALASGQFDDAINHFDRALANGGAPRNLLYNRAEALHASGQVELARDTLLEALAMEPEPFEARCFLDRLSPR